MILRVKHDKDRPYVVFNKATINDSELSFKALGILLYLLSKPNDWQIHEDAIADTHRDGRDSVRAGLKELRDRGYIRKVAIRGEDGKIERWETHILESLTQELEGEPESQMAGFPPSGNGACCEKTGNDQGGSQTARKRETRHLAPIQSIDKTPSTEDNTLPKNGNGSSGLPIFGEQPRLKNTPPDRMSQTLYKALAEKRKIMRSPDLNKWSETFRRFMVESEASVQEVEFELAWYIEHIGQEFIPRACSAESFCERFVDIRDARLRIDPESEPKPKASEFKAVVKKSTLSEEEFHKMIMDTDQ